MRAVHFGAGNIGRGFIGLYLTRSGYDLTFVEANAALVELINAHRSYPVITVGRGGRAEEWVRGVQAIRADDVQSVVRAVANADIVTTAVGKAALARVAPLIAEGLRRRRKDVVPVVVVACENLTGNSTFLGGLVRGALGHDAAAADAAVFPNCMVDRIVPNAGPELRGPHPLAVVVEDYAQWVIDVRPLAAQPPLQGVAFSDSLDAVLAQKLCTVNAAHAMVAYYGNLRGHQYIHEAIADENIRALLDGALAEAGRMLSATYGIAPDVQDAFARRAVIRLENPLLRDEVKRVARDPMRKLGHDDRLVRPALGALEAGVIPAHLGTGVAAALLYDVAGDREAVQLRDIVRAHGVRGALEQVSGVPHHHALSELVHAAVQFRSL